MTHGVFTYGKGKRINEKSNLKEVNKCATLRSKTKTGIPGKPNRKTENRENPSKYLSGSLSIKILAS